MDTQELLTTETARAGDSLDIGQKVMIGVIALVVIAGGYFVFRTDVEERPEPVEPRNSFAFTPVVDGDRTYTLGGLEWMMEPQQVDEQGELSTRVRLKLIDFRKNNVPVNVGLYRLGTYRGECKGYDGDAGLSFIECVSGEAIRQLGVFQEGGDIVVKARSRSSAGPTTEEFLPILTINVAHIIQPL